MGGMLSLISDIFALVPFLKFNILQQEGRHQYCDHYTTSNIGSLMTWVPFLLVTAWSDKFLTALYVALGLHSLTVFIEAYRSTFRVGQDVMMFLDMTLWVGFVVMAVYDATHGFDQALAGPILSSLLLLACILSILVRYPFALQFARQSMSDEQASAETPKEVRNYCWVITVFWLMLFIIMSVSSWVAYALFRNATDKSGELAHTILGEVVPSAVPVFGFLMTALAKWYGKKKFAQPKTASDSKSPGENNHASESALNIV